MRRRDRNCHADIRDLVLQPQRATAPSRRGPNCCLGQRTHVAIPAEDRSADRTRTRSCFPARSIRSMRPTSAWPKWRRNDWAARDVRAVDRERRQAAARLHRNRRSARAIGRPARAADARAAFVEKARLAPGCTFVVGVDTVDRIGDPKYYGGELPSATRRSPKLPRRLPISGVRPQCQRHVSNACPMSTSRRTCAACATKCPNPSSAKMYLPPSCAARA